jgi:hypothetical protein
MLLRCRDLLAGEFLYIGAAGSIGLAKIAYKPGGDGDLGGRYYGANGGIRVYPDRILRQLVT